MYLHYVTLFFFHCTLLHPERPKFYTILVFLSAIGLKEASQLYFSLSDDHGPISWDVVQMNDFDHCVTVCSLV